ncbi:site-specific DNA-methyltransferase, partial [Mesorhizobium sp. M00.F.Ca.ET.158.01.1.1]
TVKPIALLQYLIRHITPAGGVVLDMFAGSGTTAEAAKREGFDCILMEAEPEYLEFLHTRFHFASDTDIGINALAQKGATDENFINADLCLIDILGENVLST